MKTVSVHDAKAHLSALIADVEDRDVHVVICRYGRAVAELVPCRRGDRTRVDRKLGKVKVCGDLTAPTAQEWENA